MAASMKAKRPAVVSVLLILKLAEVMFSGIVTVSDITAHLLRSNIALEEPPVTRHTEIALPSAILDTYAGQYEEPEEGLFIIARDGDFLTIRLPNNWGLPKLRLRPESLENFFVAELPLRVSFPTGSDRRVNGRLAYPPRGQHSLSAKRMGLNK